MKKREEGFIPNIKAVFKDKTNIIGALVTSIVVVWIMSLRIEDLPSSAKIFLFLHSLVIYYPYTALLQCIKNKWFNHKETKFSK